jgi:negative regulator of sigma E activity
MSELLNEQLSALVDGELPVAETALLLKRLEREPELAARLARYQAYGDLLRGHQPHASGDGLRHRISAALKAEAPLTVAPDRARVARLWTRAVSGLAVAAGVAAVSLVLLQQGRTSAPTQGVAAAVPAGEPTVTGTPVQPPKIAAAGVVAQASTETREPVSYVTPAPRPRLQVMPQAELARYVMAHSEVSAPLAARSVLVHLVADAPVAESPDP